jgi:hypothetical protein
MTTDDKPVWFMDIDGVLNIFPKGTPPQGIETGEASPFVASPYGETMMFPITWKPEIIKRILDMHNEGIVEVKWLTTWGRGANYGLHELIGLPKLDVVADPEDQPYRSMGWHTWWKAAAVRAYLTQNNPSKIVWTDDDLIYHKHRITDIVETTNIRVFSPADHKGITHSQLDIIEQFLRQAVVQTDEDGI